MRGKRGAPKACVRVHKWAASRRPARGDVEAPSATLTSGAACPLERQTDWTRVVPPLAEAPSDPLGWSVTLPAVVGLAAGLGPSCPPAPQAPHPYPES